jgi:hypothetical protein
VCCRRKQVRMCVYACVLHRERMKVRSCAGHASVTPEEKAWRRQPR